MDPISIKVTFDDLPLGLKNGIQIFFTVLCTFIITITLFLYMFIFDYIYTKYIAKNDRMQLT